MTSPFIKFSVTAYSEESLAHSLTNDFISPTEIKKSFHYIFLKEYFSSVPAGVEAKSIVIEEEYVSKAFLSDYSSYYSRSFYGYKRFCKRLHFFDNLFDNTQEIENAVLNNPEILENAYLGYVVVKPLPDNYIGTTILKTYPKSDNHEGTRKRYYNAVKEYKITFFGRILKLKTLAFQAQDTVVSACATSALWSAFHKTSELFQTALPTPNEITRSAGNILFSSGRLFPNQGLDITQICRSIESVGLEPELRNDSSFFKDITNFKRFTYAYNRAGIPVLIAIKIDGLGYHLITIGGYAKEEQPFKKSGEISLRADLITRFYAHDDQVGPFCRLGFKKNKLETSWWKDDKGHEYRKAEITALVVPLYHKIRICFEDVLIRTRALDKYIELLKLPDEPVWDIFLISNREYKNWIVSQKSIPEKSRKQVGWASYPYYIWVARMYFKGIKVFDLIFDTTDVSMGFFCIDINVFSNDWQRLLTVLLEKNKEFFRQRVGIGSIAYGAILEKFIEQ